MKRPNVSMTSLEAAALILSNGATTDVEQAELIDQGKAVDPDALQRAYFRRQFGFDFDVFINEDKHQIVTEDKLLGIKATATWLADDIEGNAKRMAKACLRLKKLHDTKLQELSE